MRTSSLAVLVCGALLLGCGEDSSDSGTGGKGGGGGSAGSTGGRGGTGGATGGTGGSTGGTGGSTGGTGGSTGGTGGGTGGTGGSGGTGGTGGSGGAGGSGGGSGDAKSDGTKDSGGSDTSAAVPGTGMGPYGCANCKRIFDGTTLEGWETRNPAAWVAKDGALASTGKANDIWTKDDFGDFRIFFEVRQTMGNHKPDVIFFGNRPAPGQAPRRGLGGAQFQPPNGGSWDYGAGGTFKRDMYPGFNERNWHQCEVLVREAGSFRAACCPKTDTPCKGTLVLTWMGKGKKAPFGIQMHNPGLYDEYREIWVELNPTEDALLSMK
jgi:hypothetical protein